MKGTADFILKAIARERLLLAALDGLAGQIQNENPKLNFAQAYAQALERHPNIYEAALGAGVLFPKRLGLPDEFAQMALHIVENTYLNGETLRLDGGLRMPPK